MTTSTPPARPVGPARPITPRPLWERDQIFQEPAYAAGLMLLEDDDDESEGESGIITP